MNPDFKGRGAPRWQAGADARPQLVIFHESPRGTSPKPSPPPVSLAEVVPSHSARGLALESLRITSASSSTSTSTSSLPGAWGAHEVQRVERKSEDPDALPPPRTQPAGTGAATGQSSRSLRELGGSSPEMARFHAVSRHLAQLPLSRAEALTHEGGSDGQVRRRMARVLTQAQLHTGAQPPLADACIRLLKVDGFAPALVGLVAGTLALESGGREMTPAERECLIDAILKESLRASAAPGVEQRAVAVLKNLCEAIHGTGHWMPQSAPFIHMVIDRLLAPASSPQAMGLLRAITSGMLLQLPPAKLPAFLAQVLDPSFVSGPERSDRLRALVGGLADKTSSPPNDACVSQFLGYLLQEGTPPFLLAVLARELARHPALWEQACQPRILTAESYGRLLLARTGAGLPDHQEGAAPGARRVTAKASSITTKLADEVETKAGPVRRGAAVVDQVAQVLALPLSLVEGAEDRLAREVMAIYLALEGAPDTEQARDKLKMGLLNMASEAPPLMGVAVACGWGLAVGAASMDSEAFGELIASFQLPSTDDAESWVANGSLGIGLDASRDLYGLLPETVTDPELRTQVVQVCLGARGPVSDHSFGQQLMRLPELEVPPLEAVFWLDELVKQFSGPDIGFLATATAYLHGYAQVFLGDVSFAATYGLNLVSQCAGRIHAAARDAVSRRYEQCLWMSDAAERDALLALARRAAQFLDKESNAYRQQKCPLPLSAAVRDALEDLRQDLHDSIDRLASPSGDQALWSLAVLFAGPGTQQGWGKGSERGKS